MNDQRLRTLAAVVLVMWMCLDVVDSASLRHHGRQRGLRQRSRADPDRPYFWMCPEVLCPAVRDDCETIEYIVFQYDYEVRGRVVNVRCESCEYCLDMPASFQTQTGQSGAAAATQRRRRSATGRLTSGSNGLPANCPEMQCPVLTSGCRDERLTDVLVAGVTCKRCPACYDSTLFNAVDA